ncbi:hypothetical protein P7C70_g8562, partial [Phenoliferia sp. Uapishka_3]
MTNNKRTGSSNSSSRGSKIPKRLTQPPQILCSSNSTTGASAGTSDNQSHAPNVSVIVQTVPCLEFFAKHPHDTLDPQWKVCKMCRPQKVSKKRGKRKGTVDPLPEECIAIDRRCISSTVPGRPGAYSIPPPKDTTPPLTLTEARDLKPAVLHQLLSTGSYLLPIVTEALQDQKLSFNKRPTPTRYYNSTGRVVRKEMLKNHHHEGDESAFPPHWRKELGFPKAFLKRLLLDYSTLLQATEHTTVLPPLQPLPSLTSYEQPPPPPGFEGLVEPIPTYAHHNTKAFEICQAIGIPAMFLPRYDWTPEDWTPEGRVLAPALHLNCRLEFRGKPQDLPESLEGMKKTRGKGGMFEGPLKAGFEVLKGVGRGEQGALEFVLKKTHLRRFPDDFDLSCHQ